MPSPRTLRGLEALREGVWIVLTVLLIVASFGPDDVRAQAIERPSDRPLPLPAPTPPPLRILPTIPALPETQGLFSEGGFFVVRFRVVGNSVFDPEDLEALLESYTGRQLSTTDLHAARDLITAHYVAHGYLNSGAWIPDQDIDDGVVELRIIEGRLESISITGLQFYRPAIIEARIALGAHIPLSVTDIEERLQILQQDPRIARVRARMLPGSSRGLARLVLDIDEAAPWLGIAEVNNQQPPGIGSTGGYFEALHQNLVGLGDTLSARYKVTRGLDRVRARYEMPIGPYETLLLAEGSYSRSDIVEGLRGDFDKLGIRTRFRSVILGIEQSIYRSSSHELRIGATGEWRKSTTILRNLPIDGGFPFPGTGADSNGDITVAVVRLSIDWLTRLQTQVLALRSTVSIGVDALGAGGGSPDEHFVSWLGQAHWARRFEPIGIETLFRLDVQLANSALPALEQFAAGGYESVRGYHENEIVRDQGVTASLEVRIPLYRNSSGRDILQLAPFADFNHSLQVRRRVPFDKSKTIASLGIGLRGMPTPWSEVELYWGHALTDVDSVDDLQDDGVHFRIRVRVP